MHELPPLVIQVPPLFNFGVSTTDLIPVGIKGGASGSLDVTDGAMIEGSRFESRNLGINE